MSSLYVKLKHPQTPYYALAGLFLLHVALTWPGTMTPDSQSQYSMAITGNYSDHHPPVMSFTWRYLNMVYPGPGLVLLLHLFFLYAAAGIFISTFKDIRIKFFYLLLPIIPSVLVYSWMIWKDVGFAFSYLLLAAILTHLTLLKKRISLTCGIVIFLTLFYGTAVKFQAQYCAPLILLWIAYIYNNQKLNAKAFTAAFIFGVAFFMALNAFNSALIPDAGKSHSWQHVKLYDLAAISYATDRPLFPEFAKRLGFSMEKLKKLSNSQRVDDLTFGEDAILQLGKNDQERQQLWDYWFKTVLKYPFIYAKHRLYNSAYTLLSVPGLLRLTGSSVFWESSAASSTSALSGFLKMTLIDLFKIIATLLLAHLPVIILGFFYIILAVKALPYEGAAVPLLFINLIALSMVIILFFFSMAGTPRYTYMSICLTNASNALAFLCGRALVRRRYLAKDIEHGKKNS